MSFKIGEKVVYPNHGIGVIEKITTTDIGGAQSSFYLLRLKATESTVMVPIKNAVEIGLRSPIKTNQCQALLDALSADFSSPPVDWKDRYKEFLDKMKTGDIFHVAEVLKNLTYLSLSKPLSFREKRMLERARYLVISEIATVCRKNERMVEPLVDEALQKSCMKHTQSVTMAKPVSKPSAAAIAH
ncbi:MAG TPA: CarD family transcriptional regulator [Blastocatellia bacterium]|nr:CarD family transcriptional regulator [Blastocatellia bacterium]